MRPGQPEFGRSRRRGYRPYIHGDVDPVIDPVLRDFGNADREGGVWQISPLPQHPPFRRGQWDDGDTDLLRPPPPARHARPAVDTSWVTTTADRVEPDRRTRPWEFLAVCAIALLITLAAGGCITVAVMRWLGMEI